MEWNDHLSKHLCVRSLNFDFVKFGPCILTFLSINPSRTTFKVLQLSVPLHFDPKFMVLCTFNHFFLFCIILIQFRNFYLQKLYTFVSRNLFLSYFRLPTVYQNTLVTSHTKYIEQTMLYFEWLENQETEAHKTQT